MQPERPDQSRGVFETLLVRDGRVHALDGHLRRLSNSVAELYGFELPADLPVTIRQRALALAGPQRLRIDAIPDADGLRFELQSSPFDAGHLSPVVLEPVAVPGGIGGHKWCDRRLLDSLASPGRVPLLLDRDGEVLEAARANLWLIEDQTLVTPPADGRLLPGVTRELLLGLAPAHRLDARVEPISIARVRSAGAIFLTSALRLAVAAMLDGPASPPASVASARISMVRALLNARAWT